LLFTKFIQRKNFNQTHFVISLVIKSLTTCSIFSVCVTLENQ